jgi:hypothetical protein
MSIPFGDYYGATFKEIIVIREALEKVNFDEPEKEKVRLSLLDYTHSKIWSVYPYQAEDYYHQNPTPRKDILNEEERNK